MKRSWPLLAFAMMAGACGGSPSGPTVTPPPVVDPGPVVNNTPPVVGKFTVQGTRNNEPPNFADVNEDIPVTVEVTDAESSISSLKFNWNAGVGTFTGTGNKVIWKAPADVSGPTIVTLNVEVIETYTSQGKSVENRVTSSTTLSLHDSIREVADISRQFLLDFSDSTKDVATVMRNFQQGCYGTADETSQVTDNRSNFTIIQSNVGPATSANTTVNFGGFCPFRAKAGDACSRIQVYWKSVAKKDVYDPFGTLYARSGQQVEAGPAIDQLAAMYYKDQQQWKLCDSSFDPDHTSLRAATIRGLVP